MLNPTTEGTGVRGPAAPGGEPTRNRRVFRPNVDIVETEQAIELFADMPGVDERSTEVTLERDVLTIKGRVDWETPASHRPLAREFEFGDYERTFTLTTEVAQEQIVATVKDGVLHLVLPKAAPAKAHKIAVKSG